MIAENLVGDFFYFFSIRNLHPDALRFLIAQSMPVNKGNIFDTLLDMGLDPKPPLLIPRRHDLVQILLEAGADPFHRSKSGHTLWTNALNDTKDLPEHYNYLFGPALAYVTDRYHIEPHDVFALCCHRGKHVLSVACEGSPVIASAILANLSVVFPNIPRSVIQYSGPKNSSLSFVVSSGSLLDQLNDHDLVDFAAIDSDGETIFDYAARGVCVFSSAPLQHAH
jgi:ankyrin repeat protein